MINHCFVCQYRGFVSRLQINSTYKKDKEYVKSFRANINETQYYIHDQYPPEIVEQRKNLLPILKKAKTDKKDAYIKYNKLFVGGNLYTDGPYGKV